MQKKGKKKEVKSSKDNKKRNIILIVCGLLLIIILFLLWFFNRKFEVTFDYNNGTEDGKVLVKYNNVIDDKDIKTKEDLGEKFINWYLIVDEKDGKDVLAEEPFNFETKIKENTNLKAVYDGTPETITITFDSKGGSKVDSITINKGSELTLPKNPTYSGYTFNGWFDKNDKSIKDKTIFEESATLYAKWSKVAVKTTAKKTTIKKTTTKTTTTKKAEESISLSLTNPVFTPAGTKKGSKAVATVKNASGKVTYSISGSTCIRIDSETGVIKVAANKIEACVKSGAEATVTATLPSGKSASKTVRLEKQLILTANGKEYSAKTNYFTAKENTFTVIANQTVSNWETSGVKEITNKTVKRISGKGNADVSETSITAVTAAGQRVKVYFNPYVA